MGKLLDSFPHLRIHKEEQEISTMYGICLADCDRDDLLAIIGYLYEVQKSLTQQHIHDLDFLRKASYGTVQCD